MAKPKSPVAATAPSKVVKTEQNARRRQANAATFAEFKKNHKPKVARGTARSKRRAAAAASGLKGETFSAIWQQFRETEKPAAPQ